MSQAESLRLILSAQYPHTEQADMQGQVLFVAIVHVRNHAPVCLARRVYVRRDGGTLLE